MENTSGVLFLATLVVGGISAYVIYQCFLSPLASFPGPFAAKISKIWRARFIYTGRSREMVEVHRKYGPVVRIGPNDLSVGDPDAFRQIYRSNGAFVKAPCYSVFQGSRPFDLVGERNEKIHGAQRSLVARPYSMESMKHLEPRIEATIEALLRKLDAATTTPSKSLNLGQWLQLTAFDIIGAVSFGEPFEFVAAGTDNGLFARLQGALDSAGWVMHVPWFHTFHQKVIKPVLGNYLALNDRHRYLLGYFFDVSKARVEKRKKRNIADNRDIVGQLLQVQAHKPELTDTSISYMMTSNVMAGADTTSAAMRSIFFHLFRQPHRITKLRAEIQERCGDKRSEVYSAEDCENCPLLQAVLYEGMRLLPSVPFILERSVPPEGMTICGKHIPGGTVVGSTPWVIHRIPKIWGPDPDVFRPERWLDADNVGEMKRLFFQFGGGTRPCIGRNISWLEVEKIVATLIMRYDFEIADDADIRDESRGLTQIKSLKVNIFRRST
ncbi:cytochrome P450 family protein [Xylariaceae sp. FL1019]|nr:cytochrome P450 family protein [Xylariaceae sp. FL1019]